MSIPGLASVRESILDLKEHILDKVRSSPSLGY